MQGQRHLTACRQRLDESPCSAPAAPARRRRGPALAALALACGLALPSCTVGSAREIDTQQHLSGLDLHHLQQQAQPLSAENTETIEGRVSGLPFGFAPLVTADFDTSSSLHRGEVTVNEEEAVAPISGFEHRSGGAVALGAALYHQRVGSWDPDGGLLRWQASFGIGWGLAFAYERAGDAPGVANRSSVKFLCGLLGYTGDESQSTLHLLWLPLPIW